MEQIPITSLEELRGLYPEIDDACFKAATLLLSADISRPCKMERGYFPTILVIWPDIHIEVSEVDYEYYDVERGKADIRHYPHADGTKVADELLDLIRDNEAKHDGLAI
ncbi:hypothetical protein FB593_12810 [Rhizobium sp. SJZ105]|uniref:hypothetical protein n=1 Tax=Rhizobium sp. SJZ105 TaxID=2572678 RepID=UPI00119E1E25|nr:hypothetical protein [Rhizobium sp. SJZ105]TWC75771.1 hypothetical protein FB593_12810 [Rhizobium sp. SJZ105]